MKATLTNGTQVELLATDFNPVGQIILGELIARGVAEDECDLAELLGAAPCEIRYGMIHPQVEITQ